MKTSGDELAGVIDLFGALTPAETERAIAELAFKRGEDAPDVRAAIASAVWNYRLVAIEPDPEGNSPVEDRNGGERSADSETSGEEGSGHGRLLVPGPTAFPVLPDGATDLPHIMELDARDPRRDRLETAVEKRFRAEAARAARDGEAIRIEELLDVSYDLQSWGEFDFADVRARLDAASAE